VDDNHHVQDEVVDVNVVVVVVVVIGCGITAKKKEIPGMQYNDFEL
jgi:hypothetical protein